MQKRRKTGSSRRKWRLARASLRALAPPDVAPGFSMRVAITPAARIQSAAAAKRRPANHPTGRFLAGLRAKKSADDTAIHPESDGGESAETAATGFWDGFAQEVLAGDRADAAGDAEDEEKADDGPSGDAPVRVRAAMPMANMVAPWMRLPTTQKPLRIGYLRITPPTIIWGSNAKASRIGTRNPIAAVGAPSAVRSQVENEAGLAELVAGLAADRGDDLLAEVLRNNVASLLGDVLAQPGVIVAGDQLVEFFFHRAAGAGRALTESLAGRRRKGKP